jgi:nucleoid DNA-binding protein
LAEKVAEKTKVTKKQEVYAVIGAIRTALASGGKSDATGFGTFK